MRADQLAGVQGYHICGVTLLSGPPHQTILVGAAHCYSVGDTASNYKVINECLYFDKPVQYFANKS